MDFIGEIILVTLLADLGLGVTVYFTNRQRSANQQYLIFSFIIALWLACIGNAMISVQEPAAAFLIRQSHVLAALIVTGFNFLRHAIMDPGSKPSVIWKRSRWWLLSNLVCLLLCNSGLFLRGVSLPATALAIPEPDFGPGFQIFSVYFVGICMLTIAFFVRDTRRVQGIQRAELQFVMLAGAAGLLLGSLLAVVLPLATNSSQATQFTPLATVVAHTIIAYGIATSRIMEVAQLLQRTVLFIILLCALSVVYVLTRLVMGEVVGWLPWAGPRFALLVAAVVTAVSVRPVQIRVERASHILLAHSPMVDFSKAMQQANALLQSIATLDDLLQDFSRLIAQAVDALHIRIYLYEEGSYLLASSNPVDRTTPVIPSEDPLVKALRPARAPLSIDDIVRMKLEGAASAAGRRLQALDAHLALGIRGKEHLEGFILLGPRVSGRIYGAPEQDRLQFLANQFAVAVENARLYTQVQDSKIYNDILVDNMVGGVIAVNTAHQITVFNREAQRITHLSASKVLYQPMNNLPRIFAEILGDALVRSERTRDQEVVLRHAGDEEIPLRVGSSVFHSHTGQALGALIVFSDLTQLKKLEHQVRRTDRLASVGTLAAGMAHEIKNPLVAVKTFTQLLPERYDDEEFRETFSSLIGDEVQRIDSIVNQMLDFARPAKPILAPVHLHAQVNDMVLLIGQQMKAKSIELQIALHAEDDRIEADINLLRQALVNLLLNAIDSMPRGGILAIRTDRDRPVSNREPPGAATHIRLSIQDHGEGIPPESLTHIFDPFFTTKDRGTGLGLSVSHGIIAEHKGTIDVDSEVGVGTVFTVTLPLMRKEVPA